jgi:NADH-quinone oxidoreductase subunit C
MPDPASQEPQLPALTALLSGQFPGTVRDHHCHRGDETVVIKREALHRVCQFLRDDERCKFEMMIDLTAVDYFEQGRDPRFEVVYHFKSLTHGHRLRLKVQLSEANPRVDSIHDLWDAVDWYERECFDMFGIVFEGHPNLTRLLMYEQFEGHPLRKDYPMDRQQPIVELREVEERYEYGRKF